MWLHKPAARSFLIKEVGTHETGLQKREIEETLGKRSEEIRKLREGTRENNTSHALPN